MAVQLLCKHRLQHVSASTARLSTLHHDQMKLIDKQNDLSFALLHFLKYRFQTFSNSPRYLAPATSAPISRAKIFLFLRPSGTSPATIRCASPSMAAVFTNARLTDENRVVLSLTGKDTDNIPDLHITADHRIKLLGSSPSLPDPHRIYSGYHRLPPGLSLTTLWFFLPDCR